MHINHSASDALHHILIVKVKWGTVATTYCFQHFLDRPIHFSSITLQFKNEISC